MPQEVMKIMEWLNLKIDFEKKAGSDDDNNSLLETLNMMLRQMLQSIMTLKLNFKNNIKMDDKSRDETLADDLIYEKIFRLDQQQIQGTLLTNFVRSNKQACLNEINKICYK